MFLKKQLVTCEDTSTVLNGLNHSILGYAGCAFIIPTTRLFDDEHSKFHFVAHLDQALKFHACDEK